RADWSALSVEAWASNTTAVECLIKDRQALLAFYEFPPSTISQRRRPHIEIPHRANLHFTRDGGHGVNGIPLCNYRIGLKRDHLVGAGAWCSAPTRVESGGRGDRARRSRHQPKPGSKYPSSAVPPKLPSGNNMARTRGCCENGLNAPSRSSWI